MELIDQVTINDLSKRDLLLIIKSLEFTSKKTKNPRLHRTEKQHSKRTMFFNRN